MRIFDRIKHRSRAFVSAIRSVQDDSSDQGRPSEMVILSENGLGEMVNRPLPDVINFETLEWWQGGMVLIAEGVSLGILSLPFALRELGLVPGIIVITVLSVLTTYSGLMLGEFSKAYPGVENFGDAVEIVGSSIGLGCLFQEVFGWGQVMFQTFVMASHVLTWTICMNNLTDSSTCTLVWAGVGLAVFWILNMPRTLKYTSWMSFASFISVTTATLMTVGSVVHNRSLAPIDVTRTQSLSSAMVAVLNVAISFSSHSCFFSIIREFKRPQDFPKALALLQSVATALYLVTATVIYVYVGPTVPSPALSIAEPIIMKKAIWAVATPTIVIAGVIYGHVAVKYVFVRIFRGTRHFDHRTVWGTVSWILLGLSIWSLAMVISQSIPVFTSLLGLVGALFVSWFSFGLPGIFYLWMKRHTLFENRKTTAATLSNIVLVLVGTLLCVLGAWASIQEIRHEKKTKPWSCDSNAQH